MFKSALCLPGHPTAITKHGQKYSGMGQARRRVPARKVPNGKRQARPAAGRRGDMGLLLHTCPTISILQANEDRGVSTGRIWPGVRLSFVGPHFLRLHHHRAKTSRKGTDDWTESASTDSVLQYFLRRNPSIPYTNSPSGNSRDGRRGPDLPIPPVVFLLPTNGGKIGRLWWVLGARCPKCKVYREATR